MTEEYIDILDENGEKTGESFTYSKVHKEGLIHRTVRVYFLNSKNQVLLQKRSKKKQVYPNRWDAGVGGHISAGETSVEGAQKETREEIGLDLPPEAFEFLFTIRCPKTTYKEDFTDNEFNDIYLVRSDLDVSTLKMEEGEVDEVRWFDLDTFKNWIEGKGEPMSEHQEEYSRLLSYFKNSI